MKIMASGPVIESIQTVQAASSSTITALNNNGWDASVSKASLNVDTYTLWLFSTNGNNNIGISKSSTANIMCFASGVLTSYPSITNSTSFVISSWGTGNAVTVNTGHLAAAFDKIFKLTYLVMAFLAIALCV